MRRRSRVLAVTIGALASALAACSVITGLNGDYTRQDEDNGGDADATIVGDTSSLPDSTMQPDASSDGGSFCQQYGDAATVAFCWDFEGSRGNPTLGFSSFDISAGSGTLTVDSGTDRSLGLVATITNPVTSGQAYVQEEIGDGAPGSGFAAFNDHWLEFDFVIYENTVNVVTIGSLGYPGPTKLQVTGLATYWDKVSTTEVDISSPPGNPGGSEIPTPYGLWMHAQIHLTRTGASVPYTTHSTVGSRDGTTVPVGEVTQDFPTFDSGAGKTEILVGAYFTSETDASAKIAVGIDNVLYRRQ